MYRILTVVLFFAVTYSSPELRSRLLTFFRHFSGCLTLFLVRGVLEGVVEGPSGSGVTEEMPGTQALADISRHTDSAHLCACLNVHDDVTILPYLIGHVGVSPLLRLKISMFIVSIKLLRV